MTENMKNLDEEIAQQIKNDHIKKMVFTARNYSLEDVETIVCGNLNTIAYEYEKALSALRASWEREKEELIAESKRAEKEWGYKSEDHYIDKCRRQEAESRIRILEAEKQALEAEKKGLETQLSAWFSTFGTNQLSHAIDRLESAEKEKARLEERVRDMDECLDEQHDELTRLKAENAELKETLQGNICAYCLKHEVEDCPHNPNKRALETGPAGEGRAFLKETTTIEKLQAERDALTCALAEAHDRGHNCLDFNMASRILFRLGFVTLLLQEREAR